MVKTEHNFQSNYFQLIFINIVNIVQKNQYIISIYLSIGHLHSSCNILKCLSCSFFAFPPLVSITNWFPSIVSTTICCWKFAAATFRLAIFATEIAASRFFSCCAICFLKIGWRLKIYVLENSSYQYKGTNIIPL